MYLVTGAGGFIGYHVCASLLARGFRVIGVDVVNDYYEPSLKIARLERLHCCANFAFHQVDIADHASMLALPGLAEVETIVHLAAQAGVRYSIEHPFAYGHANLQGHLSMLELVRSLPAKPLLLYASSSSVYGANTKVPFSEMDRVDEPISLYAATKRSCELMSESYARLYELRQVGLRFFTVYGPWGRPDMAYWTFTQSILEGRPIPVFNEGQLRRDFTYIDDIVSGIVAIVTRGPRFEREVPHMIYNIGNNRPVELMTFIAAIEAATGRRAVIDMRPMQPGDVLATYADIASITRDYGYAPTTSIEVGIPRFVAWYTNRYGHSLGADAKISTEIQ